MTLATTDLGRTPRTTPAPRKDKHPPVTLNPSGSHTGGACQACGRTLQYWIAYKLCDTCLPIWLKPARSIGAGHVDDTGDGPLFVGSGKHRITTKRAGSGKG